MSCDAVFFYLKEFNSIFVVAGKTLTVISLIIESNNREKEMNEEEKAQEESESSESDEEDEKLKSKWAAKGRRDCEFFFL